jgi:predicted AlkP superfamily phosphohydrolase/phosphomutase
MLDYELERFDSGVLFYYISSTDQRQHMFWRLLDEKHPAYDPGLASKYGKVIENTYREADQILAKAMDKIDRETVLIVMSDHGFNPFSRSFSLNAWLKENGYHVLTNPFKQETGNLFPDTDWSRTKAFGVGLNGLYINQRGREAEGIVGDGAEKENLVREIARKLEEFVDPKTGEKVLWKAYVSKDVYSGPFGGEAPDIILGFNRGYRISFGSPLGKIEKNVLEDNRGKWSGENMGKEKIKLDKSLMDKVRKYAEMSGYSSVEEFITHCLEKEIAKIEESDSEEEIKKKLKGLGYIS